MSHVTCLHWSLHSLGKKSKILLSSKKRLEKTWPIKWLLTWASFSACPGDRSPTLPLILLWKGKKLNFYDRLPRISSSLPFPMLVDFCLLSNSTMTNSVTSDHVCSWFALTVNHRLFVHSCIPLTFFVLYQPTINHTYLPSMFVQWLLIYHLNKSCIHILLEGPYIVNLWDRDYKVRT